MAFPAVEDTATSAESSNVSTHTISLPFLGAVEGELYVAFFSCDGNETVTWPAGPFPWVELFTTNNGNNNTLSVAWQKISAFPSSSVDVTTGTNEQSAHIAYRISGVEDPDTQPPEVGTPATGSDANPDPSSTTPTGGAKDYLWIACEGNDDDDAVTADPTDYTDGLTRISDTGAGTCSIGTAQRNRNIDVEDPATFTIAAGEEWVAATVVIHPPNIQSGVGASSGSATVAGVGDIFVAPVVPPFRQWSALGFGRRRGGAGGSPRR